MASQGRAWSETEIALLESVTQSQGRRAQRADGERQRRRTLPTVIHLGLRHQLTGAVTAIVERLGQVVRQRARRLLAKATVSVPEVHGGRKGTEEARQALVRRKYRSRAA